MLPSLELAKQLSTHCHVIYLISANKIKELESKGFIPISNANRTLDIVGLIDGNDDLLEFELQDSQIKLNNTTMISPDNRQKLIFNNVINRMGIALNQLFHSNQNQFSLQPLTTQHISLPIDMIIIRPFTPISLSQFSIPIHLFLPSNLRGVVNYIRNPKTDVNERKEFYDYIRENIPYATGFICNSLKEFDKNQQSMESKTKEIIDWLDKQPVASVIYIAFGSIIRLPPYTIDSVAHAVSNYSFIWSLKIKTSFPSSLMNLDSNRQLVLEWVPQRAILSHPSISFFFSHGGWNSLLESMFHGKALLVWPFVADQFDNALQLIDMGMACQVSDNLQTNIEHMSNNNSYSSKAKEIQQIVIKAQEKTSKEQIIDIVQLMSNNRKNMMNFNLIYNSISRCYFLRIYTIK
ncbi:unnamed protein product [Adineta steineri]|uniref:Uncharacterized protein n=1 Tax=Adineta steineri TaxID=433720 RepID=A0A818U6P9_9BILA|nr:unnamed protein product [Adineta steineri]